jgi:hypothetical protein
MIYGVALVIPWCRRQRDRFAKFIRSADDVVTVLGLHSGGAHEARFLSIRDAGKFRIPRRQDMAMARGHYHRADSPISIPCGPIGISKRRNLNLSVHHGDIRPRTICA